MSDEVKMYLNMLKAHNSKTSTIISGFRKSQKLRETSKNEGIPLEQLIAEQPDVVKKKKKATKVKVTKQAAEPEIEIKIKGSDGQVTTFTHEIEQPVA